MIEVPKTRLLILGVLIFTNVLTTIFINPSSEQVLVNCLLEATNGAKK